MVVGSSNGIGCYRAGKPVLKKENKTATDKFRAGNNRDDDEAIKTSVFN